jgi:hypothetical protein
MDLFFYQARVYQIPAVFSSSIWGKLGIDKVSFGAIAALISSRINDGNWSKIASHVKATSVSCGHNSAS